VFLGKKGSLTLTTHHRSRKPRVSKSGTERTFRGSAEETKRGERLPATGKKWDKGLHGVLLPPVRGEKRLVYCEKMTPDHAGASYLRRGRRGS